MENQNPAPVYQDQPAAAYSAPVPYEDASPLSIGSYLIMMIVSVIPLVNLIMLFVWGFGNSNRNRKNYARAQLIILAIGIVLSFIFGSAVIAAFSSIAGR
jgi:ABC-type multidrug transport system permease subunit